MDYGIEFATMIDVDRVFLDLLNPRHDPYEDQDAAIYYLCHKERVLPLAVDIINHGLNPLELFAVIAEGDDAFFAAEGNRRLCAIKLLNDPDLAPAELRKDFDKASKKWTPIDKLFAMVFSDRDEVKLWLDRIHAGFAEGRGRRQWNAEQKARNSGYSKNDLAQLVLDAGQDREFITQAERVGRLSTVQRYLGNPVMRDVLGLDVSDISNLSTDLPADDFEIIFKKFINDVAQKTITTRDNAKKITGYSHDLRNLAGVSGERSDKHPIAVGKKPDAPKPKPPKKPTKIEMSNELQTALDDIPSYKLAKIYYSLCSLSLAQHTPLLSVGAWTFIETLTALNGRNAKTNFHSFLSPQVLQKLGIAEKEDTTSIREAVKRISELGNSTKHNKTSASFNWETLANDFENMEKMLIALAVQAKGKS